MRGKGSKVGVSSCRLLIRKIGTDDDIFLKSGDGGMLGEVMGNSVGLVL